MLSHVDTTIANGMSPVIIFRNNVKYCGTVHGGQAAGQPTPGTPIDCASAPNSTVTSTIASGFSKGRIGTLLAVVNPFDSAMSKENDQPNFQSFDGKKLFLNRAEVSTAADLPSTLKSAGLFNPPHARPGAYAHYEALEKNHITNAPRMLNFDAVEGALIVESGNLLPSHRYAMCRSCARLELHEPPNCDAFTFGCRTLSYAIPILPSN